MARNLASSSPPSSGATAAAAGCAAAGLGDGTAIRFTTTRTGSVSTSSSPSLSRNARREELGTAPRPTTAFRCSSPRPLAVGATATTCPPTTATLPSVRRRLRFRRGPPRPPASAARAAPSGSQYMADAGCQRSSAGEGLRPRSRFRLALRRLALARYDGLRLRLRLRLRLQLLRLLRLLRLLWLLRLLRLLLRLRLWLRLRLRLRLRAGLLLGKAAFSALPPVLSWASPSMLIASASASASASADATGSSREMRDFADAIAAAVKHHSSTGQYRSRGAGLGATCTALHDPPTHTHTHAGRTLPSRHLHSQLLRGRSGLGNGILSVSHSFGGGVHSWQGRGCAASVAAAASYSDHGSTAGFLCLAGTPAGLVCLAPPPARAHAIVSCDRYTAPTSTTPQPRTCRCTRAESNDPGTN